MAKSGSKLRSKIIRVGLCGCDILLTALAALGAYWMVNWASPNFDWMSIVLGFWTVSNVLAVVALCLAMGLYSMLFSSVGFPEALRTLMVTVLVGVGNFIFVTILHLIGAHSSIGYPVVAFYTILLFIGLAALRFSKRLFVAFKTQFINLFSKKKRVMIVGCNNDALTLIRSMNMDKKSLYKAACIIDPNEELLGKRLVDTRVVGALEDIKEVAKKYRIQEIFVAIPSQKRGLLAEVLKYCKECARPIRLLPELSKMTNGEITVSKLRPVNIEDLLGREQVSVNLHEVMGYIEGKIVLVTGGGGSIGSELCRQIATHNPAQLIVLDIYENNAYDIEQELKRHCPNLNLLTLIASIRDKAKVRDVFDKYRPQIVFNAAAHKHVPLMETSPNEAVKNNVFGTLNIARAAEEFHVETFVQISTDKAVNPTNIMGATKRICEMIIQTIGKDSQYTKFVAVRFGNVLGSNGSVIPLFKKQIEEGGPVTVTHKDIIRYFMTIPEAVSLVLQAGAYAKSGQIFVLDMGEPVKIYDLAYNLIKLSGYEPNVDIEIKCTGLRPGEKLFEERLMAEEGLQKTANGSISIAKPIPLDEETFWTTIDQLDEAAHSETDRMKEYVKKLVPTYTIDKRKCCVAAAYLQAETEKKEEVAVTETKGA